MRQKNAQSFVKGDPRVLAAAKRSAEVRRLNAQRVKESTDYQQGYRDGRRDCLETVLNALGLPVGGHTQTGSR